LETPTELGRVRAFQLAHHPAPGRRPQIAEVLPQTHGRIHRGLPIACQLLEEFDGDIDFAH
jgi:hypothetical protein